MTYSTSKTSKVTSSNLSETANIALGELATALKVSERIVVLTGAGISVASGIAPFRKSSDALWERNVTELATRRFFNKSPDDSWRWYNGRFGALLDTKPNPAHTAICELEAWALTQGKLLTLVTQNIDDLHRRAGSADVIEIHGSSRFARCVNIGCVNAAPRGLIKLEDLDLSALRSADTSADSPRDAQVGVSPRCPLCDHVARPHVLWFDECYDDHDAYQFSLAMRAFEEADLFLCSGTSFSVGITSSAIYEAESRGVEMWSVDPSPDSSLLETISWVEAPSEVALPILAQRVLDVS